MPISQDGLAHPIGRVFPDPDTFDTHRRIDLEKNLGFGYGSHRCIAEGLARAELEAVFCECLIDTDCYIRWS